MDCRYRSRKPINHGNHEPVYRCDQFNACTIKDCGLKKNGIPLAVCDSCDKRESTLVQLSSPPLAEQPETAVEPRKAFDGVIIINLKRRSDRLEQIKAEFEKGWPFEVEPMILSAVDGEKVRAPEGYKHGNNAWACLQSHRHAVEHAINEGWNSVLILEDDALLVEDFAQRSLRFMSDIPQDWEFAFFGGHHLNKPPIGVKPGVTKPQHMDRMHAYAARGQGLIDLYRYWHQFHDGHCDHAISVWITKRKTYCVQPWLVGQRGGSSDVMRVNGTGPQVNKKEEWWHSPDHTVVGGKSIPVVMNQKLSFLEKAKSVVKVVGNTVAHGGKLLDQSVIDQRLAICQSCDQYDGNACKLCGCKASRQSVYTNKLAHAASECPAKPPKWGKWIEPEVQHDLKPILSRSG